MTTSIIIGTLTTGEWIVTAGSALALLAMTAPIVWLCWLFVQMDDGAVSRAIADAQRAKELSERAHRAISDRS
jgi:fatty acid desaturase